MDTIKVLLVDDQVLFVENLKTVLELQAKDIEVVGICYDGKECLQKLDQLKPDIILMDVRMPGLDGVKATKKIHETHPNIKIMMLTTFDDDEYVLEALTGGAEGYMLKNVPSSELVDSIRAMRNGIVQMSPSIMAKLVSPSSLQNFTKSSAEKSGKILFDSLSLREKEILYLISEGYDNNHIGEMLYIAPQTVKNHISKIYGKLQVHDRYSAMKIAKKSNLAEQLGYIRKKYL